METRFQWAVVLQASCVSAVMFFAQGGFGVCMEVNVTFTKNKLIAKPELYVYCGLAEL